MLFTTCTLRHDKNSKTFHSPSKDISDGYCRLAVSGFIPVKHLVSKDWECG